MNWKFVSLRDATPVPWKNGGGWTRELLILPAESSPWHLRVSVAEVAQSGLFSHFEGITRWFAVLQGNGVVLNVAGQKHTLTATTTPLCFDGASSTDCQLIGGATQDFNLMVRGIPQSAHMERVHGAAEWLVSAPQFIAVYANSTGARVDFPNQFFGIKPHTLAWCEIDQPALVRVESEDALWLKVAL